MENTEAKLLSGKRILTTRSMHQQSSLQVPLTQLGGEVIALPLIELYPIALAQHRSIWRKLNGYDWIVFTSANAVDFFFENLKGIHPPPNLNSIKIACVGPITARRVQSYQLTPTLVPEDYVAEGLITAFERRSMAGKAVLLPRAERARDALPNALKARKAIVDVVPIYGTRAAQVSKKDQLLLNAHDLDVVTFTSSSTVDALEKWIDETEQARFKAEVLAFCIGPITRDTARRHGYRQVITAKEHTITGLIKTLVSELSNMTEKESTI